ncbi:MAG TPA: MBL fold metallo-hydrolase [Terriglobales bacterium]|nr:MBL fold metallo-hydrolase [Terriglobales bacterium]
MKLCFLGAARQVTGSSYYLEAGGMKVLVDCGLYQERPFLDRNWDPFPAPPGEVDVLILTHAHLDHSGLIPRLAAQGFSGTILTTAASADLVSIALMDAARIQVEDAAFKQRRHAKEGRAGAHPEVPLYTVEDVQRAMPLVEEVPYDEEVALSDALSFRFRDAGHILGSAMVEFSSRENGAGRSLVFSGDIGQWDAPLVRDPSVFERADYVVMESTYADRDHEDPKTIPELLTEIVVDTAKAGGNVVIPTFAIERAQQVMYYLSRLLRDKAVPPLPVYLDSPMAREVTEAFRRHTADLDAEARALFDSGENPFEFPGLTIVRTIEESKAINAKRAPSIIMAGSGMCTGGRIKHHLLYNIGRPESTILFVGYQAEGTLGRQILEGEAEVRILGRPLAVRARVAKINSFSAHADRRALGRWLDAFRTPPRRLFVTHGDAAVAARFAERAVKERGWTAEAPEYLASRDLD